MDLEKYNVIIKKLIIAVLVLLIIFLFEQIQDMLYNIISFVIGLLVPVIFGFIMAYLLWPFVKKIQTIVKSRFISGLLAYTILVGFIVYILAFLIPQIIDFALLLKNYDYSQIDFLQKLNIIDEIQNLKSSTMYMQISNSVGNNLKLDNLFNLLLGGIGGVISFSTSFLFSLIISIYALTRYERLTGSIKYIFPPKNRKRIMDLVYKINFTIRSYFEGLIFVGVINAALALVFYWLLGLDYAFSLALFLFLMYSIPLIGMLLSGLPAVLIAFQDEPIKAVLVIIFLIILTNVSSNIIEPKVFGSKMGVDPLVVLIGIVVVSAAFGFIGLLIAMPVVAIVSVIFKEIYEVSKEWFDDNQEIKEKK